MRSIPQHGGVDTGEVKLHYWNWPGGDPAVVCIHGLTSNGRGWDAVAEPLAGRHRVIAVDLRGRGLSDKPPAGQYGFAAHARDTAALIRALDIKPVVVAGWSMGAYVASLLAAEHPELISHVVLVDGGGVGKELTVEKLREQGRASLDRLSAVFPSLDAYLDYWRQAAPFISPWTRHFESYLTADVEERPDGKVVCRSSKQAIEEDTLALAGWEVEKVMPQIKAPALVLWAPFGMQNPAQPLFSREVLEEVTRLLPNGRLVTIEGANHFTIGFAPDCVSQVVAALRDLLG